MAARAFPRSLSAWSRLISLRSPPLLSPRFPLFPIHLNPLSSLPRLNHRHFSADASARQPDASTRQPDDSKLPPEVFRVARALCAEIRREERREAIAAGIEVEEEEEEEEEDEDMENGLEGNEEGEDYSGVQPSIDLESEVDDDDYDGRQESPEFWEQTDSESDEDDERFSEEELQRQADEFERKSKRHEGLLKSFADAETLDEAHNLMMKIEKFEEKHFKLPLEYRVIGDLMNRLKESTGKDRFVLLQKLNRALRMMEVKEAYDPNDPANFGIIQHQLVESPEDLVNADFEKQKQMLRGKGEGEGKVKGKGEGEGKVKGKGEDDEFDETKEEDDELKEKLSAIEKKIEEKLTQLDHTFGKKGRVLEAEIKELVEERNLLAERKKRPLYRKGFDVKVIDVNRTCKVTKGGQIAKYSALLATGNYHGVVGFARAKGPTAKIAIQRAYEKCFQNLHYMERYEEHTIAHAIQAQYEKTKIYLWPGPLRSGMAAGRTVETVLYLAGFSNVKSKIVGSRNHLNVIKALFKALNAIETAKDVQEKFGRTVVESYLLH
ncbi:hypothetical protein FCM35_KLT09097 [Carex littledalei]|uniref:S5 DRBM domain-containing protein n=1 Tax=Carex littledalei TaxID=544730 RepID=A0A833QQ91_9POAL|nr:hypothetical protein FCM35_KLT09097 [Carex littledalei]